MKIRVALLLFFSLIAMSAPVLAASSIYTLDQGGVLENPILPDKTVELTFDDGPSKYTPQILNILRSNRVHATFFVVGENAVSDPLLSKIYANGEDIGNHTFSHSNLSSLPLWHIQLELGLDRLVIESQTGHSTRLLRPPYLGSDSLSSQSTDMIKRVNSFGYITVGEDVDTQDWQRPGVNQIIANATEHANGGIILMHDGGGDRSQTVKALPAIINYYKQHGYHFLTISQALGASRNELMPTPSGGDKVLSILALAVFSVWSLLSHLFYYVILILIIASFARMILVLVVAHLQARRNLPRRADGIIPCSVIVPAYNEATVIQSCLKSILASDYQQFEVIVVDDGSRDNTAEVAASLADSRVRVLRKPNGGKAAALNYGIAHAAANFVIAIDADTVFQNDTLSKLMRHFLNPKVGAVSGNTRIVNRHKLITKLQSLEYVVGFNLDRRMGDMFDCITVVPGAIGAFRKTALERAGGFSLDTLAEDTDLTLGIKEAHYKIVYDATAIAYTEAPATIRDLLKQRFRWTFGTMQAVWKHRRAFLNPRYGTLGMIGLPYLVLFQIVFPIMGPFFDMSVIIGLLSYHYHLVIISFLVYTAADVIMSAVALRLDNERFYHLWLLVPQRVFYRQLMYYVILKSAVNALKGNLVGWGSLKREGKHLARSIN